MRTEHYSDTGVIHLNLSSDMSKGVYHEGVCLFYFHCLFASVLSSCAQPTPAPTNKMIEPGDQIGDFLITTGKPGEVTYQWELDSTKGASANETLIDVDWGTNVNVSMGVYDETRSGKLDSTWAGFTYEMFIEDHPVNLPAFGTIDTDHPVVGKMRAWNVVIVATKRGCAQSMRRQCEIHGLSELWSRHRNTRLHRAGALRLAIGAIAKVTFDGFGNDIMKIVEAGI